MTKAKVFLSYVREDSTQVSFLYDYLTENGFQPWMDSKDIHGGEKWKHAIKTAIRDSTCVLICVSNNSIGKRGYFRKEINDALEIYNEKLTDDIFIMPVRLDPTRVPSELEPFQWIDLFKPDGLIRLRKSIQEAARKNKISSSTDETSFGLHDISLDSLRKTTETSALSAPYNIHYVDFGKQFIENIASDYCALDYSDQDIARSIHNFRKILPTPRIIPLEGDISKTSIACTGFNDGLLFAQFQHRNESEFSTDARTKRDFYQVRYTFLPQSDLVNLFSEKWNVYGGLLQYGAEEKHITRNPTLKDYFLPGQQTRVRVNFQEMKFDDATMTQVKFLTNAILNSQDDLYQKSRSLVVEINGLSLAHKLSLIQAVQYVLFPHIGLFSFAVDYISEKKSILNLFDSLSPTIQNHFDRQSVYSYGQNTQNLNVDYFDKTLQSNYIAKNLLQASQAREFIVLAQGRETINNTLKQEDASKPIHQLPDTEIPPDVEEEIKRIKIKNDWKIISEIGSGGFGRVFRVNSGAEDCALKLIPKTEGAERELLFVELGRVRNVVPILEVGETTNEWVIVMPLADCSLRDRLVANSRLPLNEAIDVLLDICSALADLSDEVIHRDIKPENVLLLDDIWCLADFGISRYAEASTDENTKKFAWTNAYCAPERWRFERATSASDIYSVGIMFYELLSGQRPFTGPDFRDQHLHSTAPRLEGVPSALAAIVDECLYKAPEARPTAKQILTRVNQFINAPSSLGRSKLAAANLAEVKRKAEEIQKQSQSDSKKERRILLFDSSKHGFIEISNNLKDIIANEAPSARISQTTDSGWNAMLGTAQINLSGIEFCNENPWKWEPPSFEVIAYSSLQILLQKDSYGYLGRSHSLWFCDAVSEGNFNWYETAFMINPIRPQRSSQNPFSLPPGESSAKALGKGITKYQVAWPFTLLVRGQLFDFTDRWVSWFADAANGKLHQPSTMPELNPIGSWRNK